MGKLLPNLRLHKHLKWKICFYFVPIMVVSIICIVSISGLVLSISAKESVKRSMQNEVSLVAGQVDRQLQHIAYNIQVFSISSMLQDTLRSVYYESSTPTQTYNFNNRMRSSISTVFDLEDFIGEMQLVTQTGILYRFPESRVLTDPAATQTESFRASVGRVGRISMRQTEPGREDGLSTTGPSSLLVEKSIIDVNTGRLLGVLSATVKESVFAGVFADVALSEGEQLFVMDREGRIVSHADKGLLYTHFADRETTRKLLECGDMVSLPTGSGKVFAVVMPVSKVDWYVVRLVPEQLVFGQYRRFVTIVITCGVVFLFVTVIASFLLARRITSPLSQLVEMTNRVSAGDFDTVILTDSMDEIRDLTAHFNRMSKNVKLLTHNIWVEQRKKREYELSFLQGQINPHLLYNSLDRITRILEEGAQGRAATALDNLGRYYKKVLDLGAATLTVEDELELTRHYLVLQSQVSPGLFRYAINVPPEILRCRILKLSLQPLVENAILHGFVGLDGDNLIEITGRLEGAVLLEVRDNGRGMAPETVSAIGCGHGDYSAIGNIDGRIKLQFGSGYGIEVTSFPGFGTTVSVRLPYAL